jgi:hypothetical protein
VKTIFVFNWSLTAALITLAGDKLRAGESAAPDSRYGLFNALDHRSSYGQFFYPEPFLVDEADLESEVRLQWLRTGTGSAHTDEAKVEIEKSFGLATLELEVPYGRDSAGGQVVDGMANIDLGARYPFYQFVSRNGMFDTTFGAGVELGIPTTSDVSHNTELVPKIFNATRIGNFSVQTILGDSMLFGPGADGGVNTLEYGLVFGYDISHRALHLPGIDKVVPIVELAGETQLNKADAGQNNLVADVGVRLNLKAIGRIQPRPGVAFVFPLDNGAHAETHWGIVTSLVFEF